MLTYESLRRFVNEEKDSKALARLPDGFFKQAESYLKGKEKLKKGDDWELESASRLLQDLLEIRERKLLIHAFYFVRAGPAPENMAPREKKFFEKVVQNIKAFHSENPRQEEDPKPGIKMLQDVPEFVAPDMKTYGPFRKGEKASVPDEVKKLFIEKGFARK